MTPSSNEDIYDIFGTLKHPPKKTKPPISPHAEEIARINKKIQESKA